MTDKEFIVTHHPTAICVKNTDWHELPYKVICAQYVLGRGITPGDAWAVAAENIRTRELKVDENEASDFWTAPDGFRQRRS